MKLYGREQVRTVECPECGAARGERCFLARPRKTGKVARTANHRGRVQVYKDQMEESQ